MAMVIEGAGNGALQRLLGGRERIADHNRWHLAPGRGSVKGIGHAVMVRLPLGRDE